MDFFFFVTVVIALGCTTAIAEKLINLTGDSRRQAADQRASLAEARVADLQAQVNDLHHRNAELERHLDWSRRLTAPGDRPGPPETLTPLGQGRQA